MNFNSVAQRLTDLNKRNGSGMATPRLDKAVLPAVPIDEVDEERTFWHSQPPHKRLQAIELLRELNYGKSAVSGRLQRFLEVVRTLPEA